MKHIMISAMQSDSGKTVITCALLAALKKRGISLKSFKCGPDYIDPMFHSRVLGIPGCNLDLFLHGENNVKERLFSSEAEMCVIEGAMGFYDGINGTEKASAWEIAALTDTPVILVVRPRGSGITLAAQLCGMMKFRENSNIAGVILNDCKTSLAAYLKPIIERETGLDVLGYLPHIEEARLESRHLGLMTADEISDLNERFSIIANKLEETVDIDRLIFLSNESETHKIEKSFPKAVCKIAVARDEAFCFMYEQDMDELRCAGAELCFFSPLHDNVLPACDGIYIPGGYPELHADALSDNNSMCESVRNAFNGGLPIVAECGGYMYLCEYIGDKPMCGALPGKIEMTASLRNFGYKYLSSTHDTLLIHAGESIPSHEFHYCEATSPGSDICCYKPGGKELLCGFANQNMYAAFPHISFSGIYPLAKRFVDACIKRKNET